jgi:hypothetical protein
MGRGFDIENPERIFSMHTPAGAGHGATGQAVGEGLILATVQAIISDYGGRISAESAPGAGTTFFIDLPGMAVERKAPPKRRHKAERVPTKSATPLVGQPVEAPSAVVVTSSSPVAAPESQSESVAQSAPESASEIAPQPVSEPEPLPEAQGEIVEQLRHEAASEIASNPVSEDFATSNNERLEESAQELAAEEPADARAASEVAAQPGMEIPAIEATAIETPVEETESEPQVKDPVNVGDAFAVLAQITLEGQSEFWDDAPGDIPVFSFEGSVTSDESVTAPTEQLQNAHVEGEREVPAQEKSGENVGTAPVGNAPPAEPSLLDTLEEILEAPGKKSQDVEKKVAEKTLEKEIWRSPLTYR